MLKGISPCVSPDLLKVLCEMGHGDEILLADSHFPGHSMEGRVLRADGLSITALLDGVLPLFELDAYNPPLIMMSPVQGDPLETDVEERYMQVVRSHKPSITLPLRIDRYEFYRRAQKAFAIVMTGETAKYANLLLKKGVTPIG